MPIFSRSRNKIATTPTNARKVVTGTSYTTKGMAGKPEVDREIGSSQPVQIREVVPELQAFNRLGTYARMMNDAGVNVSMRAWKTPVLGAEFFVEPYSSDPLDIEASEFIAANLFEGLSAPFLNSLEDILRFCEDGFTVLEKVYENREWSPKRNMANRRVYTMLKKFGVRPASTVTDIVYDDNGGPVSIKHNAIRPEGKVEEVEIKIEDLIIFTFGKRGGDLMGQSLLRTAYPHWYYKTHMYKIDAIQKERHGIGVPRGKTLAGADANDKIYLRQMLRNLRTNEESFILQTPAIEVDFVEVPGQLVDVIGSASHHNMMILMNVMGQFLSLGVEGSGGGRATGGTQSDLFMKALRYLANVIADAINMYLIPELIVYNYPTTNFPKLKVRNIGETRDLQMLGSAIANVLAQGGITYDIALENWLRNVFDIPLLDPDTVPAAPVKDPSANGNSNGNLTPAQRGNVKPGGGGNAPSTAR